MKRTTTTLLIALALLAPVTTRQARGADANEGAAGASSGVTPTTTAPDADLRSEVLQLQQLVRDQQKRIEALEAERPTGQPQGAMSMVESSSSNSSTAGASQDKSTPAAQGTAPQGPNYENVQAGSSDERIRNLERQIKGIGPISFSGDVRLRAEPFFGGPHDHSLDRARGRERVRFNALADLGSQFRVGMTLASGDINDPTSTNQTFTGFYTRKAIALDQAFAQFTPDQFKQFSVIGGKFRYPWYNTELTWDKDLNPEGAAETLGFKINNPVLKRFAVVGFELPFAEVAGTSSTNKRIAQQITYGAQVQTQLHILPHVDLSAYTALYDFRGADQVALALARASTKNPQTPFSGYLPLTSGNTVQDSTYTTTATSVVTIGGTAYATGVTAITNAQFASKFSLLDNIARLDIDTGHPRFPVYFLGDYVQNMEACANLPNIAPPPANTGSVTYKQTVNSPCISNQRRGYWLEGRVGRLQQKGDLQFGYMHLYIEREAVLGNFNYSDMRQGTNVTQHRIDTYYQFDKNVQLGFTALIGRPLGSTEPWLTRLQFDTIYIF